MRVLIAADRAAGERARQATEVFGYRCRAVETAADALRAADAERPDVVVAAPDLADGDGIDLCRQLRGVAARSPAYLILFAEPTEDLVDRAMAAGVDDLLGAPLVESELHLRLQVAERMVLQAGEIGELRGTLERTRASLRTGTRADTLTGLGNRLQFDDDLDVFQGQLDRYGHRYAAVLLDLDLFKPFVEQYGQLAAEEAVRVLAQTVVRQLRTGDRAYRFGSDQLAVLFPEQPLDAACVAAERIRDAFEKLELPHADNPPWNVVTLSAGVAAFAAGEAARYDALLGRAEGALRTAKAGGRNRVVCESAIQADAASV